MWSLVLRFLPFLAGGAGSVVVPLAIGAVILTTVLSLFFYVQSLRSDVTLLNEQKIKLSSIIEAKDKEREVIIRDLALAKTIQEELSSKWKHTNDEKIDLERKFRESGAGRPRNLDSLAYKQPKLVEGKINRGTIHAFRCNEIATGSPVRPEDADNRICPDLIKRTTEKKP